MKSVAAFGSIVMSVFTLSLTACVSEPQVIRADVSQWAHYAFTEHTATVAIKVPPYVRVFNSSLPELTYTRAQRLLLDAQYDFGRGISSDTSQFEIKVHLAKLVGALDIASANVDSLDAALALTFGHPIKGSDSPYPIEESIRGKKWIYYDNTTDVTYGQTRETYATVVDNTTVLLITAWYGPDIRMSPRWFDSRRRIFRDVRDNTSITRTSKIDIGT